MSPYKLFHEKKYKCYLFNSFIHCYIIFIMILTGDFSCKRHYAKSANRMLGPKLIEWTRVDLNRNYGTLCIDCQVI